MNQNVFRHWQTSLFGVVSAGLVWWQTTGFEMPTTRQEYAATIGGVLLAVLGLSARDPRTPPEP